MNMHQKVRRSNPLRIACALSLLFAGVIACGSSGESNAGPTNTGQSCSAPEQCFGSLDAGALVGTAICLDKVPGGYCTHSCSGDGDCCAVPGECPGGYPEVCAPFESTGQMDCFLSCEDSTIQKAGYTDSTAYCAKFANAAFSCRSTGGGSKNRKVCVPN